MKNLYKSIFKHLLKEKRMKEYKAWYSPSSNKFIQFSTNGLHSKVAEENFKLNEAEAIEKGYYRIFCGHELNIDSWTLPSEKDFKSVQRIIEDNSYKKISATRWNITTRQGMIFFPKLSFFFAESIKAGEVKTFR